LAVLITGLGYIGARLAEDLLAEGQQVVALENFFCTPRPALVPLLASPGFILVEGTITSRRDLQRAFRQAEIASMVHLAAQPSAHPRAASTRYTEQTNLVGARLALEAALDAGVERVVLGSSFKVYGELLPPVVDELQPYGAVRDLAHLSKIYVEKLAEMLGLTRGLPSVSVRLGITYGLGRVMKTDPRFMTVPNHFAQLAARGQPLTVHPGAVRPGGFIHLADASRALRSALSLELLPGFSAVNAHTECITVGEVASAVAQSAARRGVAVSVEGPLRPSESPVRVESSLPHRSATARQMGESIGEVFDYFLERAAE
jgi:UDP-glucuronate decarboxylase